jgi:hypothetical protein
LSLNDFWNWKGIEKSNPALGPNLGADFGDAGLLRPRPIGMQPGTGAAHRPLGRPTRVVATARAECGRALMAVAEHTRGA